MIDAPWSSLATVFVAWSLAVILPGPNFVATAHAASATSRSHGLRTAAGIALGTALWTAFTLGGLGAAFSAASGLYQIVRWAGAAYLVFVGLRTIIAARKADDDSHTQAPARARRSPVRHGLAVVLSNPKTAAFFTSLFAVAVPPDAPLWFKALVAAVVVLVSWTWYSTVACAMSRPSVSAALARMRRALAWFTGGLLIFFGLRLATER